MGSGVDKIVGVDVGARELRVGCAELDISRGQLPVDGGQLVVQEGGHRRKNGSGSGGVRQPRLEADKAARKFRRTNVKARMRDTKQGY